MSTQDKFFSSGEGDNYFDRNYESYTSKSGEKDFLTFLNNCQSLNPKRSLEIGCANGKKISKVAELYNCESFGIDPSEKAIKDGQARFPNINLSTGISSALKFEENSFDFIIIYFVLCWVDRKNLSRTYCEVDRVLQDGGYILIADFEPDTFTKRHYHHKADDDLWTYKQDYALPLKTLGTYNRIAAISLHSEMAEYPLFGGRKKIELLRKNIQGNYIVENDFIEKAECAMSIDNPIE